MEIRELDRYDDAATQEWWQAAMNAINDRLGFHGVERLVSLQRRL